MHDRNGDGLIIPDAALPTSSNGVWNQLPTTDMFVNCKKYDSFSLAPGEVKSFTLKFKFYGTFPNFIKGLALTPAGEVGAPNYQHDITRESSALGTSILFAFDKVLSTGTNNVIINYEATTRTAAILGKKKLITMIPATQAEVNPGTDDTSAP